MINLICIPIDTTELVSKSNWNLVMFRDIIDGVNKVLLKFLNVMQEDSDYKNTVMMIKVGEV